MDGKLKELISEMEEKKLKEFSSKDARLCAEWMIKRKSPATQFREFYIGDDEFLFIGDEFISTYIKNNVGEITAGETFKTSLSSLRYFLGRRNI